MAIQIGTVDGLITISKDNFNCFISAIHTFSLHGGVAYAAQKGVSLGTAFQRYVEPVYSRRTNRFDIASIDTPYIQEQETSKVQQGVHSAVRWESLILMTVATYSNLLHLQWNCIVTILRLKNMHLS